MPTGLKYCKIIKFYIRKKETFFQYIRSLNYIFLLYWFTVNILFCNFYLGSVSAQLDAIADDDQGETVDQLVVLYSAILPLGGLSIIGLGSILDRVYIFSFFLLCFLFIHFFYLF